jgi:hypothetical protein
MKPHKREIQSLHEELCALFLFSRPTEQKKAPKGKSEDIKSLFYMMPPLVRGILKQHVLQHKHIP